MATAAIGNAIAKWAIKHFHANTDLTEREAYIYFVIDWVQLIFFGGYSAFWIFKLSPEGIPFILGMPHLDFENILLNEFLAWTLFILSLFGGSIITTCARNKIRIHWLSKCISFFVKDLYEAGDKKNQDSNDVVGSQ